MEPMEQARIIEEAVRRYMAPGVIADAVRAVEAQVMQRVEDRVRSLVAEELRIRVHEEFERQMGRAFTIEVIGR